MAPKPQSPEVRFWKHVAPGAPDECWKWQGATMGGYGYMLAGKLYPTRWAKAHRLSWEMHRGPIPEGQWVLHHCDNPPCVNPAHLYLGTPADNAGDRGRRGRGREAHQHGEANANAKLTEDQVRAIIRELQVVPRRSQASIAAEFGVIQQQVSRIMHRKSWAHLWDDEAEDKVEDLIRWSTAPDGIDRRALENVHRDGWGIER